MSFSLVDHTYLAGENAFVGHPGGLPSGMTVKFFRKSPQELPRLDANSIGDIVMVRQIKSWEWAGAPSLLSSQNTVISVFPTTTIPELHFKAAFISGQKQLPAFHKPDFDTRKIPQPQPDQIEYVIELRKWAVDNLVLPAIPTRPANTAPAAVVPARDKFKELKEVKNMDYADVIGEVVKVWPGMGGLATIYLTDYTSNPFFFNYLPRNQNPADEVDGDEFGYARDFSRKEDWQGPRGKLTAQITLWPPHSAFVASLEEKDIVKLRNVNFRLKDTGFLEGGLHGDRKYPDRIDIRKYQTDSDPRFTRLLQRREEHWKKQEQGEAKGTSKQQKKKKKRQEKKALEEQQRRDKLAKASVDPFTKTAGDVAHVNRHVRCADPSHPLTTIAYLTDPKHCSYKPPGDRPEIILPFINRTCKIRARVVDFYPPNIAEFCQNLDDPAYNDVQPEPKTSTSVSLDGQHSSANNAHWEWHFYLALEDASVPTGHTPPAPQLKVLVTQRNAEYLLKRNACDLKSASNKQTLEQLKETLFILWGDLEELKGKGELKAGQKPSSRPFDCWVREYGVPVVDEQTGETKWERMYQMFQTSIMSGS
jgi:protection of telomeres protein 1